jgi:hypothetical protein
VSGKPQAKRTVKSLGIRTLSTGRFAERKIVDFRPFTMIQPVESGIEAVVENLLF